MFLGEIFLELNVEYVFTIRIKLTHPTVHEFRYEISDFIDSCHKIHIEKSAHDVICVQLVADRFFMWAKGKGTKRFLLPALFAKYTKKGCY